MQSDKYLTNVESEGQQGTSEYRLRFKGILGEDISPWHDIPLDSGDDGIFNAVIEIPRMTRAKMEVSTKESMNAIAQDIKKGKVREYHGPIYWNYGMLPQTWENPHVEHPEIKLYGDNDPLDIIEIGSEAFATGAVVPVKALGVLAMIDDGELDWKVVCIHANDPLASKLNDIGDVEVHCPGTISGIREWFRWYKVPDQKPLNKFAFNEAALDRSYALEVIAETHDHWRTLMAGRIDRNELWLPTPSTWLRTLAIDEQQSPAAASPAAAASVARAAAELERDMSANFSFLQAVPVAAQSTLRARL
jgi:inorganic pyrophosphatase